MPQDNPQSGIGPGSRSRSPPAPVGAGAPAASVVSTGSTARLRIAATPASLVRSASASVRRSKGSIALGGHAERRLAQLREHHHRAAGRAGPLGEDLRRHRGPQPRPQRHQQVGRREIEQRAERDSVEDAARDHQDAAIEHRQAVAAQRGRGQRVAEAAQPGGLLPRHQRRDRVALVVGERLEAQRHGELGAGHRARAAPLGLARRPARGCAPDPRRRRTPASATAPSRRPRAARRERSDRQGTSPCTHRGESDAGSRRRPRRWRRPE